jgi:hypothetical protein
MKGRFSLSARAPLKRATEARREQAKPPKRSKKAVIQRPPEPPAALPRSDSRSSSIASLEPIHIESPAKSPVVKTSAKDELIHQYNSLADRYAEELRLRDTLKSEERALEIKIAEAYRQQQAIEEEITSNLAAVASRPRTPANSP